MRRNFDNPVVIGVGLVLGLLLLIAGLTYRNTRQLNEDAGWVAHTHEVHNLTSDVMLTLVDAETGQRGFLITGKDEFLQPYDAALVRLDGLVAKLRDKTKDNSGQQARSDDLQQAVATHVADRRKEAEHAEQIVETEVDRYLQRLQTLDVVPVIVSLQDQFETIRQAEIDRVRGRLGKLSADQEQALEALTNGIVNKILHMPISSLKTAARDPQSTTMVELVRKMFKLRDEVEIADKPASETDKPSGEQQ